ncbi:hypothetical protein VI08_09075 [Luteibacter yeojuensis]|uniref:Uncharacterized protein n=2 Tax=Luteibacter yeojuensis TaxID=345309 RepID=A0A0F3KUA6_9GAMM|nr:hypothetical protein VI08_09075 [Luteibacter yeojuensis]
MLFYQRFFPHLLREVGDDRYELLNALGHPVGLAGPAPGSHVTRFVLKLERHHIAELEALGARMTMSGIELFADSDDPNNTGAAFSDYANRLQVLSDLIIG